MVQNVGRDRRDLRGTMLGDPHVTLPSYEATLGVTINAAPAAIWPWLVQTGYRRGYSHSRKGKPHDPATPSNDCNSA